MLGCHCRRGSTGYFAAHIHPLSPCSIHQTTYSHIQPTLSVTCYGSNECASATILHPGSSALFHYAFGNAFTVATKSRHRLNSCHTSASFLKHRNCRGLTEYVVTYDNSAVTLVMIAPSPLFFGLPRHMGSTTHRDNVEITFYSIDTPPIYHRCFSKPPGLSPAKCQVGCLRDHTHVRRPHSRTGPRTRWVQPAKRAGTKKEMGPLALVGGLMHVLFHIRFFPIIRRNQDRQKLLPEDRGRAWVAYHNANNFPKTRFHWE